MKKNKKSFREKLTPADCCEFARYCHDIKHIKKLDHYQQRKLLVKAKAGNKNATDKLVEANLKLVVLIIMELWQPGTPLMDLISEGNLSIYRAIKKFDLKSNYRFSTYLRHWVWGTTQNFIKSFKTVHIPFNQIEWQRNINYAEQSIMQVIGNMPSTKDVAKMLKITPEQLNRQCQKVGRITSLDTKPDFDPTFKEACFIQTISPDTHLLQSEMKENLNIILADLSGNELQVVKYYFGIEQPCALDMVDISQRKTFKISPVQVMQAKNRAYKKIEIHGLQIPALNATNEEWKKLAGILEEKELLVLKLYLGYNNQPPLSFQEISEQPIFHLSFERVRQILEKAKKKLKRRQKEFF